MKFNAKVKETDSSLAQMGKVVFVIEVAGKKYKNEFEIEFRPNLEYYSSNGEFPETFVSVHLESKIRNDLEKKGLKEDVVEIEWKH